MMHSERWQLFLTVRCQEEGQQLSRLRHDHLTAKESACGNDGLITHAHPTQKKQPSVQELETLLESCMMELNEGDEVWPNLYIGNIVIAHDKEALRRLGITHMLNAAHAAWGSRGCQAFYGEELHYHGISAEDAPDFDLSVHFRPAADYIHKALSAPQGKILVHCILGKSRSATLVLAYLMIYQNLSLRDAIERVLQHRAISPNQGFLKQLQDLDLELQYKINPCQLL